jgi:hypothetical protein
MADRAYSSFLAAAGSDADLAAISMVECITFARLAAAQGTSRDAETLVYALARFGEWQADRGNDSLGQTYDAAALKLADAMADDGHEGMCQVVANAGNLPAETFRAASIEPGS